MAHPRPDRGESRLDFHQQNAVFWPTRNRTLWLFDVICYIAMERSTIFKNGKPSISMGHFPWLCYINNQRVFHRQNYWIYRKKKGVCSKQRGWFDQRKRNIFGSPKQTRISKFEHLEDHKREPWLRHATTNGLILWIPMTRYSKHQIRRSPDGVNPNNSEKGSISKSKPIESSWIKKYPLVI